jgi:hypothetical protein
MDQQIQTLVVQLADTAIRNTAGAIADRIAAVKGRQKDKETIAELEEIINGLLADKSELVRIAQAFEQELVAQRISTDDIEYISANFVPLLRQLIQSAAANGQNATAAQETIDLIQPLLSFETVTILQLIGFNFRKAIGEPLTELVGRLIMSKAQADPKLALEIQRAYLDVARDPEAHARLVGMLGT